MSPAPDLDLPRLLAIGGEILDAATGLFVEGLGSPRSVDKGDHDFATDVDLELERRIGGALVERTGIGVHGEEFGGPSATEGTVWVLDPIDGTYNYSAGLPMAAMLLALLRDGEPLLGFTWLPLARRTLAGGPGRPLLIDGRPAPSPPDAPLAKVTIGFGPFNVYGGGRFPGIERAKLQNELSHRAARLRMTGSTGVDMAAVATGAFGGAIAFSSHAWDNAAGAALVRAAGGVATDLYGEPWTAARPSLVAGMPAVHAELMTVIADREWRRDGKGNS